MHKNSNDIFLQNWHISRVHLFLINIILLPLPSTVQILEPSILFTSILRNMRSAVATFPTFQELIASTRLTPQTCSCTSAAREPAEGSGWCALGYHMAACGSQSSSPGRPGAWRYRTTCTARPAWWWREPGCLKQAEKGDKKCWIFFMKQHSLGSDPSKGFQKALKEGTSARGFSQIPSSHASHVQPKCHFSSSLPKSWKL